MCLCVTPACFCVRVKEDVMKTMTMENKEGQEEDRGHQRSDRLRSRGHSAVFGGEC